ncbi:hypothetical protein O1M63_49435 [Streptomyces mirabilis]|nr:hypothetical protein [Streptomyces mirabilis]
MHLVCALQGLPVAFTLTGAKVIEREVLLDMLADMNYYGRAFEHELAATGVRLLRPACKGKAPRAGSHLFKPLRQLIESVHQTGEPPGASARRARHSLVSRPHTVDPRES